MYSTLVKTRFFTPLVLLAVFVASCTPAAIETAAPVASTVIQPTATFPPPVPTVDISAQPTASVTEIPTEAIAPTAIPVATSRGPNLEATDPTTVDLASGQLQFVEFFRFT
jgi:hypothetical protein